MATRLRWWTPVLRDAGLRPALEDERLARTPPAPCRYARRAPARARSGAADRGSRAGAGYETGPLGVSTVIRRRCGCCDKPGRVVDARRRRCRRLRASAISVSTSIAANTAATLPSVSARRFTRSRLVAKFGSAASAASPSTFSASTRHSRSFWIAIRMSAPSRRLEHAVGRDRRMREADAAAAAAAFVMQQRHRHPVGHGVEQRDRRSSRPRRCGRARCSASRIAS